MFWVEKVEKLSNTDLKTILITKNMVISGGRDGKIRVLCDILEKRAELDPKQGYVNCLAVKDELLFAGCHSGNIVVYNICNGNIFDEVPMDPIHYIRGHTSNVCCLDVSEGLLISSSWDCTVRVWKCEIGTTQLLCVNHPATVWAAKFVHKDMFVTGCADKLIRIYKEGKLMNTFSYHISCVRNVVCFEKEIISVDNEGIIIKMSLDGGLLKHRSARNFMYNLSLCVEEDGGGVNVVCCGENGKVLVLDRNLRIVHEFAVPVTSCWCAIAKDKKVYAGGSDGGLYVYCSVRSKEMSGEAMEASNECVTEPKNGGEEFVSEGQRFKVVDGDVYQKSGEDWIFFGKEEGTKSHDNTFQVELDNRYYTLSFNNDENVYEVADEFVMRNKLSEEFREDVVDFIKKNFVQTTKFRIHDTINSNGVRSILSRASENSRSFYPNILENLESPTTADSQKIEEELNLMLSTGPVFVALDLVRYFTAHGHDLDLSFILRFSPRDKKETVAFVRLLSNLLADPPFDLGVFHSYVLGLKDRNIIEGNVLDDYFTNVSLVRKV